MKLNLKLKWFCPWTRHKAGRLRPRYEVDEALGGHLTIYRFRHRKQHRIVVRTLSMMGIH